MRRTARIARALLHGITAKKVRNFTRMYGRWTEHALVLTLPVEEIARDRHDDRGGVVHRSMAARPNRPALRATPACQEGPIIARYAACCIASDRAAAAFLVFPAREGTRHNPHTKL